GSCDGFRNGNGINDHTITLGNVADLSGPVPGLFSSAQQATQAIQAYFNSVSAVCGRKLKGISYDSQTSAIGDQHADQDACDTTLAMAGSIGAFDSGGVKTVENCGIPDIRAISTTPERVDSRVSFDTDSVDPRVVSRVQYQLIKSMTGD